MELNLSQLRSRPTTDCIAVSQRIDVEDQCTDKFALKCNDKIRYRQILDTFLTVSMTLG